MFDIRYYKAWAIFSQIEPRIKTKKEKEKVFVKLIWEAFSEKIETEDIWKNLLKEYNK